jgi:hypothetical protein
LLDYRVAVFGPRDFVLKIKSCKRCSLYGQQHATELPKAKRSTRDGQVHQIVGCSAPAKLISRWICARVGDDHKWHGMITGAVVAEIHHLPAKGEPTFASRQGAARKLRRLGVPKPAPVIDTGGVMSQHFQAKHDEEGV